MFQPILCFIILFISLAGDVQSLNIGVKGLSLLEFFIPLGNVSVNLQECSVEADTQNATAYELLISQCRLAVLSGNEKILRKDFNSTIYMKYTSMTNSSLCPATIPTALNEQIDYMVSNDSWSEWSVCDNSATCGGGLQRRRYKAAKDQTTNLRKWEERRLCNQLTCLSTAPACRADWVKKAINRQLVCVPPYYDTDMDVITN